MLTRSLLKPLAKRSDGARNVYLISGLGGHVLQFRPLANALAPDWHMIGILYPVFAGSDQRFVTIEALAAVMAEALLEEPDPIVIVGYSVGGAIAFEVASVLRAQGRSVAVVMLDTSARTLRVRRGRIARNLQRRLIVLPLKVLGLWGRFARPRWEPKEDNVKLLHDDTRQAFNGYIPTAGDIPIVLIRAKPANRLMWMVQPMRNARDYGWSKVATVAAVVGCRGNHLTIAEASRLPDLTRAVNKAFDILFARISKH